MSEQTPPHDLHAEQALIGAAILDATVTGTVGTQPGEFYRPTHEPTGPTYKPSTGLKIAPSGF